jgi:hypothetical protein
METLPPAASLTTHDDVITAFHHLFFQAKNQAKAAVGNGYPIIQNGNMVLWILLIGPYWMPLMFRPSTDAELTVRDNASAQHLEGIIASTDAMIACLCNAHL